MNNLAMKKTAGELARCYEQVSEKIDRAYAILEEAKKEFNQVYDYSFDPVARNCSLTADAHKDVKTNLKQYAWRRIIDLMQVQKLASTKRWKEIQTKLYDEGINDMPDITEGEIIRMYQAYTTNAKDIFAEAVKEVWNYLRPGKSRFDKYKTNDPDRIGEKVILSGVLEHMFNGQLQVKYYYKKELSNVDKVFYILDGHSDEYMKQGYVSPLIDAINTSPEQGECKYFSWRGYQNGNLHLTLKRMDLVDEMAKILSENSLKEQV
jgi:hypothetical protein